MHHTNDDDPDLTCSAVWRRLFLFTDEYRMVRQRRHRPPLNCQRTTGTGRRCPSPLA
jgi:hypothetical protein